jgi:tagatose 6-phosphate kinase
MILTVTPNPCVDKSIFVEEIQLGEKHRPVRYACVPGGKGTNVARAVSAMGYAARPMVIVGGHTGVHVVEMIQQQDKLTPVPVWVKSPTRTITTILEEGPHRQTPFFEPGSEVTGDEYNNIVDTFTHAVKQAKVVALSGTVSDKRIARLYGDLIPIAHEAGAKVILDTYREELRLGLEQKPYMVKPNEEETAAWVGFALDSEAKRLQAIDKLHEHGVKLVVMSLGPEGLLASCGGERVKVTPPAIREINAVGSGDSLVAGFAIGIQEEWTLTDMATIGVAMGTANAMTWDIGHFTKEEVEKIRQQVRVQSL